MEYDKELEHSNGWRLRWVAMFHFVKHRITCQVALFTILYCLYSLHLHSQYIAGAIQNCDHQLVCLHCPIALGSLLIIYPFLLSSFLVPSDRCRT